MSYTPAGWSDLYPYTADLLPVPPATRNPPPTAGAGSYTTEGFSLGIGTLGSPGPGLVRFLLSGIKKGFRIGFDRRIHLRSAARNMLSASEHPEVVQAYLDTECSRGGMLGPFSSPARALLPPCHVSRFGVIPKGRGTGKWRLITDLSFPPGQSVNDGVDPDLCSLTYTSVDRVAEVIATLPPGALLAKIDIESAYRLVPVHPQDRPLQAVE